MTCISQLFRLAFRMAIRKVKTYSISNNRCAVFSTKTVFSDCPVTIKTAKNEVRHVCTAGLLSIVAGPASVSAFDDALGLKADQHGLIILYMNYRRFDLTSLTINRRIVLQHLRPHTVAYLFGPTILRRTNGWAAPRTEKRVRHRQPLQPKRWDLRGRSSSSHYDQPFAYIVMARIQKHEGVAHRPAGYSTGHMGSGGSIVWKPCCACSLPSWPPTTLGVEWKGLRWRGEVRRRGCQAFWAVEWRSRVQKTGLFLDQQSGYGTKSPQFIYFRLSLPFWLRSGPNQILCGFGGETQALGMGTSTGVRVMGSSPRRKAPVKSLSPKCCCSQVGNAVRFSVRNRDKEAEVAFSKEGGGPPALSRP